jgi:hypothetical protein
MPNNTVKVHPYLPLSQKAYWLQLALCVALYGGISSIIFRGANNIRCFWAKPLSFPTKELMIPSNFLCSFMGFSMHLVRNMDS